MCTRDKSIDKSTAHIDNTINRQALLQNSNERVLETRISSKAQMKLIIGGLVSDDKSTRNNNNNDESSPIESRSISMLQD
jgi:hypothetical protein